MGAQIAALDTRNSRASQCHTWDAPLT